MMLTQMLSVFRKCSMNQVCIVCVYINVIAIGSLVELLVWPHEVEPWFYSWYRGRVETLKYI